MAIETGCLPALDIRLITGCRTENSCAAAIFTFDTAAPGSGKTRRRLARRLENGSLVGSELRSHTGIGPRVLLLLCGRPAESRRGSRLASGQSDQRKRRRSECYCTDIAVQANLHFKNKKSGSTTERTWPGSLELEEASACCLLSTPFRMTTD
jgi:hypothetical protein